MGQVVGMRICYLLTSTSGASFGRRHPAVVAAAAPPCCNALSSFSMEFLANTLRRRLLFCSVSTCTLLKK
jgi:hypothetical protein